MGVYGKGQRDQGGEMNNRYGHEDCDDDYYELVDEIAFLATVLNEIACGSVHESDDIAWERCDCPRDYARAAL